MDGRRIKRMFHFLRFTPLHPQWLIFRSEKYTRSYLASHASGVVVDIGCADGCMRRYISDECSYIGFDYPGTAIDWYGTQPDVFGDAASLPFSNNSVDAVLLLDVLEHLPDPAAALKEIQRILMPGGRLIVKVPCLYPVHDAPRDYQRWTLFGLKNTLTGEGFSINDLRGYGTPLETSMLLANLGQSMYALEDTRKFSFLRLVAGITLPILIPMRNLVAWLSTHTSGNFETMPFAVCAIAHKPRDA